MERCRGRLAAILIMSVLAQNVSAQGVFCAIDHVSLAGRDLALHFVPDSGLFVRVTKVGQGVAWTDHMYDQVGAEMHRVYPNQNNPEASASIVFLADDEEAYLGGSAHSSCTVRIGHKGGGFGVVMTAHVGLPGLPPTATTKFLPIPSP